MQAVLRGDCASIYYRVPTVFVRALPKDAGHLTVVCTRCSRSCKAAEAADNMPLPMLMLRGKDFIRRSRCQRRQGLTCRYAEYVVCTVDTSTRRMRWVER